MSIAAAAISTGSAIRPTPASPRSAISPALGPMMRRRRGASCATLRRVAALFHISGFIAGASSTGRSVASRIARGEIVGVAVCHLCHQVGGGRRHDDQVAFAREADMAGIEFAAGVEQVGINALVR